ncbi:MAG: hypothetical protein ABIJ56_18855, partial [Pseudomonadota bacterium]
MERLSTVFIILIVALLAFSCGGKSSISGDGDEDAEEGEGGDAQDGIDDDADDVDDAGDLAVDDAGAPDQPPDTAEEDVEEDGEVACECETSGECDDGEYCNGEETCDGCFCRSADPVTCDDGVACTVDDCIEDADDCQNVPDHGLCDEGEMCDPDDGCVDAVECESADVCLDGYFCNGEEVCSADTGLCEGGDPPDCGDEADCTSDFCNEAEDACDNRPDDDLCEGDDLFCTVETCDPGSEDAGDDGCVSEAMVCEDDGFACTAETCDEDMNACASIEDDGACADDLMCNGEEACDPFDPEADSRGCIIGEEPDCGDGVDCTFDSCSEGVGCQYVPDHGLCDEGEICDPEEGCTEFACETNEECDDGFFCNGEETCGDEGFCLPGVGVACADTVDCTVDSCVEVEGGYECQITPVHTLCADDLYCTVSGRCDEELGCVHEERDCGDGVDCTQDSCNEEAGACENSPNDGLCSDGIFCTVNERCDPDAGCASDRRDCADEIDCTQDSCCEDCGACLNLPDDGLCPDDLFCDGIPRCDADAGCLPGTDDPCDDGLDCTDDSCSETDDPHCTNAVRDGACLIAGACYDAGASHPTVTCLVCDPDNSRTEWSIDEGTCFISGACYDDGDRNPDNDCQVCDPDASPSTWTGLSSDPDSGILIRCNEGWGLCFSGVCCMNRWPACSDGRDNNDNDLADYPDDPGCSGPLDNSEDGPSAFPSQCFDGEDNDGDTLVDMADPGCHRVDDNHEGDAHPQCNDGADNDGDGVADFPDDSGCDSLIDDDESGDTVCAQCSDGTDNDGDRDTDLGDDIGCSTASDNDEWNPGRTPECSDGVDNDGDTLIDYPDDPHCFSRTDDSEEYTGTFYSRCSDGIDNDCDT